MKDMPVIPERTGRKPDNRKTAKKLLAECRMFFSEPENERMYLEWKAGRNKKGAV